MPDAAPSLDRFRFATPSRAQYRGMDLKATGSNDHAGLMTARIARTRPPVTVRR